MLKALGKYLVKKNDIRVVTTPDFCSYYANLFKKAHWNTIKVNLPKYGAHIGIINPKIHGEIDCSEFLCLNGKKVWFEYDITGNYGGFSKGFLNFWLDVYSQEFENIAKKLNCLNPNRNFANFHITILNTKNI